MLCVGKEKAKDTRGVQVDVGHQVDVSVCVRDVCQPAQRNPVKFLSINQVDEVDEVDEVDAHRVTSSSRC